MFDMRVAADRRRFIEEVVVNGVVRSGEDAAARFGTTKSIVLRSAFILGLSEESIAEGKTRDCMCCTLPFRSWGAGNRLCWRCRQLA